MPFSALCGPSSDCAAGPGSDAAGAAGTADWGAASCCSPPADDMPCRGLRQACKQTPSPHDCTTLSLTSLDTQCSTPGAITLSRPAIAHLLQVGIAAVVAVPAACPPVLPLPPLGPTTTTLRLWRSQACTCKGQLMLTMPLSTTKSRHSNHMVLRSVKGEAALSCTQVRPPPSLML